MIKRVFPALLCAASVLLFSCKSSPEVQPDETAGAGNEAVMDLPEPGADYPEEPAEEFRDDDEPSVVFPPEEPILIPYQGELLEPSYSFAEVNPEEPPPAEAPDEPFPVQEPVPDGDALSVLSPEDKPPAGPGQLPDGSGESGDSSPGGTSGGGPGQDPSPPWFIRPAEPDDGISPVREPLPVPVNPIPETPASPPPVIDDGQIEYSRTVRATVGQLIEIPFRGTGWVYLGELSSRRGIAYDSRRLDQEGQSFIFRAEAPGTYSLKFYKQDFIRDYILNDHVKVIIGEAPEISGAGWFNAPVDRGRVVAEPRWPLSAADEERYRNSPAEETPDTSGAAGTAADTVPVLPEQASSPASPESAAASGAQPAERYDDGIVPVTPVSPAAAPETSQPDGGIAIPADSPPDFYITKAQEEFDAGRVGSALYILDQFRERFPSGSDEAWWLYGQLLEANGPNRDIRAAVGYYRRLIQEYPQSPRYDDARRRIAYLERYYFTIQ
ncbi:tetratricopeptide repeat protein [Breznakiella homolactica]|uniref:Outer membrane lipoprotein BamD-like domain-containing protein n=1 Tax=Breznakiella homolactica TaxID=2798577 RepID=A0A7T7XQK8_9SPIR|nr:hypothetical protein [Breznakiella homolactica]QQO10666.1 hypothetical protein JFL75_07045 [Breznakiella homolactica]